MPVSAQPHFIRRYIEELWNCWTIGAVVSVGVALCSFGAKMSIVYEEVSTGIFSFNKAIHFNCVYSGRVGTEVGDTHCTYFVLLLRGIPSLNLIADFILF